MKKNKFISRIGIVILCLGVFVWALFSIPAGAILILLLVLIVAYINYSKTEKHKIIGPNSELNVEGLTEKYGNPDDVIITNPTRGNEVDACILVYRNKGLLIINGLEVKKSEITEYVLKNDGPNPYLPADYHVHITTTLEDYPQLCVSLGNELSWAEEVLKQLQQEMAA